MGPKSTATPLLFPCFWDVEDSSFESDIEEDNGGAVGEAIEHHMFEPETVDHPENWHECTELVDGDERGACDAWPVTMG